MNTFQPDKPVIVLLTEHNGEIIKAASNVNQQVIVVYERDEETFDKLTNGLAFDLIPQDKYNATEHEGQ